MSGVLLAVLLGVGVLAGVVYLYLRWWVRSLTLDSPTIHVALDAVDTPRATRATLQIRATSRTFLLTRFTVRRDLVERLGLAPPAGFQEDGQDGDDASQVTWRARAPIRLRPGQSTTLLFRHPVVGQPGVVRGWAEAPRGLGGTGLSFAVLVSEARGKALEVRNLEADLFATARERGVAPRELPEWDAFKAAEEELKGPHSVGRQTAEERGSSA